MNQLKIKQNGFSLVELMVATAIGLIISYAVLQIYLAQSQLYKASSSQDLIQSSENAIANLITPIIRSAGFTGCGNISTAVSNLNAGGPSPLGTLNTNPTMIMGYSGGGATYTITQDNPANSGNANNWTPALDATLVGNVQPGNDVLIIFGAVPGSYPIGISVIDPNSSSMTVQSTSGANINTGQFGAVSDCVKTTVFQVTGVSPSTISHASGAGVLQNSSSTFPVNFQPGAQFVSLQQTALFIGQGHGGQSSLMKATLLGNAWTITPLIPGIELMKVQYGIGSGGVITQYVSANAVTDWSLVYSVRLGFLIQGQPGSGTKSASTSYQVLDTQVTVPVDNRLRHVFEMTINLRNALS